MAQKKSRFNQLVMIVIGLWLGVCLGGAMIGGLIYFGVGPFGGSDQAIEDGPTARLEDGSLASDFELEDVNGAKVRLSDLRGKVVVMNFWATWCIPCVQEMPMFQQYQYMYPEIVMIGVDAEEGQELVQPFVQERGLDYLILLDKNGKVGQNYKVSFLPTTFLIDERGMIRFRHFGYMSAEQLDYYLTTLGIIQAQENLPVEASPSAPGGDKP